MIGRLDSYLAAKPGRASKVVIVLVIAFVLVLAGMLAAVLDLGDLFRPPYPSDDTPLSVSSNGILYTRDYDMDIHGGDGVHELLYREYRICWQYDAYGGSGRASGPLIDWDQQDELDSGSRATVRNFFTGSWPWYDSDGFEINISVTDTAGDGHFGFGDYIVVEGAPMTEGLVYTIGLVWLGYGTMSEEWSYAFDDGKFYSWSSDVLPTDAQWWST